MKKLALVVALTAAVTSPAFAASVAYNGTAVSNGVTIVPGLGSVTANYVAWSAGSASNTTAPAVNLTVASNWGFDFANAADVQFTGSLQIGDYRLQQKITGVGNMDGRQSFQGVVQSFANTLPSGTKPKAVYNAATRTLTYNYSNSTSNGGGASVESHTATSCSGNGSVFGATVCSQFDTSAGALNWEGLTLNLVFNSDLTAYTGTLTGVSKAGASITSSVTTYKWNLSGATVPAAVPVPAAAWLFGSGLLGMAGVARRRVK